MRNIKHQITGSKLPSDEQILSVLFYNIREVNLTFNESANLAISECNIAGKKAHIGENGNEWAMGMNGPLTMYEKVLA